MLFLSSIKVYPISSSKIKKSIRLLTQIQSVSETKGIVRNIK